MNWALWIAAWFACGFVAGVLIGSLIATPDDEEMAEENWP